MGLTDRLAKARSERIAQRLQTDDPSVTPEVPLAIIPEEGAISVVDEPAPIAVAEVAEPVPVTAETPTGGDTCAVCGTEGQIDLVDTFRAVAYLSCGDCGFRWESNDLGSRLSPPRPPEQPRLRG